MHKVGLPLQPVTQRPSAEQIVSGGRQSLDVLHESVPITSLCRQLTRAMTNAQAWRSGNRWAKRPRMS